jgi:ferredoxin
MPRLTVEGFAGVDVLSGKRLVLAVEEDAGVDILHACGGNARCTTCRVEFLEGEPPAMTRAEAGKLAERQLEGVRLSCQIVCDRDMKIRAISRLQGSGRADAGPKPAAEITPSPE